MSLLDVQVSEAIRRRIAMAGFRIRDGGWIYTFADRWRPNGGRIDADYLSKLSAADLDVLTKELSYLQVDLIRMRIMVGIAKKIRSENPK